MISAILTALVLFADTTPAAAATVAPATSAAPAAKVAEAKDPNAMVCHNEIPLGSRLGHKVCVRVADGEQQRAEERRRIEEMQQQRGMSGGQ